MQGERVSHYQVLEKLGGGGMGEVYAAEDTRLGRLVALKFLSLELCRDDEAQKRFRREARAASGLSHPNICVIYDVGEFKGCPYIVMELLEGMTLHKRLRESGMELGEVIETALQIADALQAAHGQGIVHRDIKPSNVFINDRGQVKLLDFGLAKPLFSQHPEDTVTFPSGSGGLVGTVGYMSPEQTLSRPLDQRSDLFSLGVLLYEMVTGERPFEGESVTEVVDAILHNEPRPVEELKPQTPPELCSMIRRLMAKDPSERYSSAAELYADLWKLRRRPQSGPAPIPLRYGPLRSIAVLPFVNLSPDPANEYFSDGLSEELINSLSRIEGLRVASRTSAFSYKGKSLDVRAIGRGLNVEAVLEGSVRKADSRLRVSAQLTKVSDGYQLFSTSCDSKLEDVFAVQAEIALQIVEGLRLVISEKESSALVRIPTVNLQAYETYLKGRQAFYQFRRQAFEQARRLFLHAAELDPKFAAAYAGVSDSCIFLYSWFDADEGYLREADAAGRKAVELAPEQAEPHVSRGIVLSLSGQYPQAREHFETAIRLAPDSYQAHYFYARACLEEGEFEKASVLAGKACRLGPDEYNPHCLLGMVYTSLGRNEESRRAFRRSVEACEKHLVLFPEDARAFYIGASGLIHLGEYTRAQRWNRRALELDPKGSMTLYGAACNCSQLGQADEAIRLLEKAVRMGKIPRRWLEHDSDLDPLRGHAAFQDLLGLLS